MVFAQGCLGLNDNKVLSWSLGEVIDPLQLGGSGGIQSP